MFKRHVQFCILFYFIIKIRFKCHKQNWVSLVPGPKLRGLHLLSSSRLLLPYPLLPLRSLTHLAFRHLKPGPVLCASIDLPICQNVKAVLLYLRYPVFLLYGLGNNTQWDVALSTGPVSIRAPSSSMNSKS